MKNTLVFGTFIALLSPAILLEEGLGVGAVFALAVTLPVLSYGVGAASACSYFP